MEKISWTDRFRSEKVLHRDEYKRNILQTIKRKKANCTGHITCRKRLLNTLLK